MTPQLSVALVAGMVLCLLGCNPSQAPQATQPGPQTANPLDQSASGTLAGSASNPDANPLVGLGDSSQTDSNGVLPPSQALSNATIGVQILPQGLGLSSQKTGPGQVRFAISNGSIEAQKVLLIRTTLPLNELPIKNETLDFENPNLQLVAQLNNGMMSAYGQDVIDCILVSGQYLLMTYSPGKIRAAKVAIITVK